MTNSSTTEAEPLNPATWDLWKVTGGNGFDRLPEPELLRWADALAAALVPQLDHLADVVEAPDRRMMVDGAWRAATWDAWSEAIWPPRITASYLGQTLLALDWFNKTWQNGHPSPNIITKRVRVGKGKFDVVPDRCEVHPTPRLQARALEMCRVAASVREFTEDAVAPHPPGSPFYRHPTCSPELPIQMRGLSHRLRKILEPVETPSAPTAPATTSGIGAPAKTYSEDEWTDEVVPCIAALVEAAMKSGTHKPVPWSKVRRNITTIDLCRGFSDCAGAVDSDDSSHGVFSEHTRKKTIEVAKEIGVRINSQGNTRSTLWGVQLAATGDNVVAQATKRGCPQAAAEQLRVFLSILTEPT